MPRIVAIADDLTGALETGAAFADHQLAASVTTQQSWGEMDIDALVIDSETRHCSADEAMHHLEKIGRQIASDSPQIIYKKTDSTLRGNIHAEFSGLMRAFPDHRIIYVPAYPAMKRTVRGGLLRVNGMLVQDTHFGKDTLNPVTDSDTRKMLAGLPGEVLDGETDMDILQAAEKILQSPDPIIAAGPASLAKALAAQVGKYREAPISIRCQQCLVVNGSMHPASINQIEWARDNGLFDSQFQLFDQAVSGNGLERARRAGSQIRETLLSQPFDAVVVFGGDTALGIHEAFDSRPFTPLGELLTGVPVSQNGTLRWITKAGGFGSPNILQEIRSLLR